MTTFKQPYHKGNIVYDQSLKWQTRVALASMPADPMGIIVRATLGLNGNAAALGLQATIQKDGIVTAPLRDGSGRKITDAHPLGSIIALRDEFRRLADHCHLNDLERLALFDELRKWCGRDLREVDNRRV